MECTSIDQIDRVKESVKLYSIDHPKKEKWNITAWIKLEDIGGENHSIYSNDHLTN